MHQEVALEVGNKVCILAGDFLLSKAAVELSLLASSDVTEIVARGLESICEGGTRAPDVKDTSRGYTMFMPTRHMGMHCSLLNFMPVVCAGMRAYNSTVDHEVLGSTYSLEDHLGVRVASCYPVVVTQLRIA